MEEKPTAPGAASESVLNKEIPENLESSDTSTDKTSASTEDPKTLNEEILNNEELSKINCAKLTDNSLHSKHNEVIHNSNHPPELQNQVDDSKHGCDNKKSDLIDGMNTCNESVSTEIDLDANDNNTNRVLEDTSPVLNINTSNSVEVVKDTEDKVLKAAECMEVDEPNTQIDASTAQSVKITEHDIKDSTDVEMKSLEDKCNEKTERNENEICEVQDSDKFEPNKVDQEKDRPNLEAEENNTSYEETKKNVSNCLEDHEENLRVEHDKTGDIIKGSKTSKEVDKGDSVLEKESVASPDTVTASENKTIGIEKQTSSTEKDGLLDSGTADAEDKKDNDENDVSPDFECSDIKEHMPSDDKQDNNDKASNDEVTENEEDPFDQVVNEAMDIDETQPKESTLSKEQDSFECREVNIGTNKNLDKADDKMDQDAPSEEILDKEINDDISGENGSEEPEEVQDFEASKGADEEICLLPDTEREISEADKERAILAKEILAKEAANKEAQEASSVFDSLVDGINVEKDASVSIDTTGDTLSTNDGTAFEKLNEENKDLAQGDEQSDLTLKESEDKDTENESTDNVEGDLDITEPLKENVIQETASSEQTCYQCTQLKQCKFQMLVAGVITYLCQKECVLKYQADNEQYTINVKKVIIKEIVISEQTCAQCSAVKMCQYEIAKEGTFLCNDECMKKYQEHVFGKFVVKYKKVFVQEITPSEHLCCCCDSSKEVKYEYNVNNDDKYICSEDCLTKLQEEYPDKYRVKTRKLFRVKEMPRLLSVVAKDIAEGPKIIARTEEEAEFAKLDREKSFIRNCTMCNEIMSGDEKNLSWETMDFCNEDCLSKYQNISHANCSNCKTRVQAISLGKYCVRFGYDIRQFCSSGCLEEFKKGLKVCSYCQKDISGGFEGFLAPVGDKGQFKDFCTQGCMEKFDQMSKNCLPPAVVSQCAVCNKDKVVKVDVVIDGNDHKMCSNPCFSAFKFVNKVFPDQCDMCKKYYERKSSEHYTIFEESTARMFCSKTCMNVFILSNRQIVPCNWCKVKKYNFDMIRRNLNSGQKVMMCSINCLTLYQVSVNAVSMRRIKCDHCKSLSQAQYHLTMSDATIRNFCTYQCVMAFQGQYAKSPITLGGEQHKTPPAAALKGAPVPTGVPKRTYNITRQTKATAGKSSISNKSFDTPVISNVQSLAPSISVHHTRGSSKGSQKTLQASPQNVQATSTPPPMPPPKPQFKTQLIVKPPCPKPVANMSTMCKPITISKSTSCRQNMATKECQTDDSLQKRILIPIPVPIYVPTPLNMYSLPYPVPVPIPLPIPVPVFIPTTRNSANGIMKEIKKIHEKMPTDPFEAELLMMAEMVAGDKKRNESDSESEDEPGDDDGFSPEGMETSNTFGEDMLQMALKMATEYDEPAVDLESAMTANTITPSSHPPMTNEEGVDDPNPMHHHHMLMMEQQRAAIRGRKRPSRPQGNSLGGSTNKRNRRVSNTDGLPMMQPPAQPEPPREPTEKPDANMCLKYTFGVNAWKQWVMTKNADLEKSSIRRKPFKSEILQLTADELNYSLCLFVKEVRKPNGSEYAPDTIYYLVLGIQQYLFENGRIDNIFTDAYYEKFTECLDEVAKKFSVLYNDSQYIVTRVEEEHLWESKQLGAHSPHVLLSTLMFFNTKHFNLVTVEEHMQLSFSHIMKHWKRNPNQPGATKVPGSRNVLLRFYPPQAALEANSRKKKVYEQQENEENPLRCPVKLYEFYLSKCPESVKTRNDVFYLLPERSCVPDSPVWYSTMALGKEPLQKMLHRVKMVKEINIALLTS